MGASLTFLSASKASIHAVEPSSDRFWCAFSNSATTWIASLVVRRSISSLVRRFFLRVFLPPCSPRPPVTEPRRPPRRAASSSSICCVVYSSFRFSKRCSIASICSAVHLRAHVRGTRAPSRPTAWWGGRAWGGTRTRGAGGGASCRVELPRATTRGLCGGAHSSALGLPFESSTSRWMISSRLREPSSFLSTSSTSLATRLRSAGEAFLSSSESSTYVFFPKEMSMYMPHAMPSPHTTNMMSLPTSSTVSAPYLALSEWKPEQKDESMYQQMPALLCWPLENRITEPTVLYSPGTARTPFGCLKSLAQRKSLSVVAAASCAVPLEVVVSQISAFEQPMPMGPPVVSPARLQSCVTSWNLSMGWLLVHDANAERMAALIEPQSMKEAPHRLADSLKAGSRSPQILSSSYANEMPPPSPPCSRAASGRYQMRLMAPFEEASRSRSSAELSPCSWLVVSHASVPARRTESSSNR